MSCSDHLQGFYWILPWTGTTSIVLRALQECIAGVCAVEAEDLILPGMANSTTR